MSTKYIILLLQIRISETMFQSSVLNNDKVVEIRFLHFYISNKKLILIPD